MANFEDLPGEVRNILYEQLFTRDMRPQQSSENSFSLFSVSKQLNHETSSYFYKHNDFAIFLPSPTTDMATILPPVSDKFLRFLKRLTIHISAGQMNLPRIQSAASSIAGLATASVDFDVLTISISSPLSNLLNSRVDDSVLTADHPITVAVQQLLTSGISKTLCINLKDAWFAPGVASTLPPKCKTELGFFCNGAATSDPSALERPLTGRFSGTHLTAMGLDEQSIAEGKWLQESSKTNTPTSLPSSLCSAFSELDNFSVTSFAISSSNEQDSTESPSGSFFTDCDIEEWSSSTQKESQDEILGAMDDIDDDTDMEDIQQEDIQLVMQNMEDTAHHFANDADISYMTNFAPELLLTRHHLGHLI